MTYVDDKSLVYKLLSSTNNIIHGTYVIYLLIVDIRTLKFYEVFIFPLSSMTRNNIW